MTISPLAIYLISTLGGLSDISPGIVGLTCIPFVVTIWASFTVPDIDYDEKLMPKVVKARKISGYLLILSCLIAIFCPSTKTMIAMYTIPPIVNNQEVQKLPQNLLKFANDYLEKDHSSSNNKQDK